VASACVKQRNPPRQAITRAASQHQPAASTSSCSAPKHVRHLSVSGIGGEKVATARERKLITNVNELQYLRLENIYNAGTRPSPRPTTVDSVSISIASPPDATAAATALVALVPAGEFSAAAVFAAGVAAVFTPAPCPSTTLSAPAAPGTPDAKKNKNKKSDNREAVRGRQGRGEVRPDKRKEPTAWNVCPNYA